ncbi:hypothetical protein AH4AK4_2023 [Aeromonas hydrophila 4AK4]|nr:hypothetical protein AH4AK4_2023 [Aeromonas hydrophila 4AK4]
MEQLNNYFRQITVSKLTTTWSKALAESITSPMGNRGVNHSQQKNHSKEVSLLELLP